MSALAQNRYRKLESTVYRLDDVAGSDPVSKRVGSRENLKKTARYVLERVGEGDIHKIPILPKVAERAMELANNPSVSMRDLERLIQPDPMLTARMLSIANSCLYTTKGAEVSTLRAAIQRLGLNTVRDVLYKTVMEAHVFRGDDEIELRCQRNHSVAVAFLARDIWRVLGVMGDYVFLCGLLHDLGATILYQILKMDPPDGELSHEDLSKTIELIHPQVGEVIADRWSLPTSVKESIRRHHVYRDFNKGSGYSQLGHVIAAAELLAGPAGLGDSFTKTAYESEAPFYELGLGGSQIDGLRKKAAALAENLLTG